MTVTNLLFNPAELPPAIKYRKLFEYMPNLNEHVKMTGRRPISRNSLLRALIYKSLRRLATLSDLTFELNNNPNISLELGFNPMVSAPSVERFSSFLHDTPNHEFQALRQELARNLISQQIIYGKSIAIDSCPIVVQLKENNLKTSVTNRFDKTKIPAGDRDARLGIMIHFPNPFQKEVKYFWGYRNHIISDIDTELPIWETTLPANVQEIRIAKSLILHAKETFDLQIERVIGDANFDSEDFLKFIIKDLKAIAVIPHNPRNQQAKGYQIKQGKIFCEAELPMYRKGKMRPKRTGILYCQYSCPIIYDREIKRQYILCPIFHHKFLNGRGCNVLIRMEPTIRSEIDYDTKKFKEIYKTRTSVERIFARLLSIAMQNPNVRGINAISNQVTIAHIAVLLVATAAYKTEQYNKIRFVRSFVPNFLSWG
jgi:hypothetical protein